MGSSGIFASPKSSPKERTSMQGYKYFLLSKPPLLWRVFGEGLG